MKMGLTQLYNCVNDPREQGDIVAELRECIVKADYAVARSLGWQDPDLEHGFYEIGHLPKDDRIRFTFSEEVRNKTLDIIYQLNQDEHDRNVAQGLLSEKRLRQAKAKTSIEPLQLDLSLGAISTALIAEQREPPSASEKTNNGLSQHASALLTWFRTTTDWRSRAEALDALKLATPEWNQAVQELLEAGLVERTGEKRGTRYRAKL